MRFFKILGIEPTKDEIAIKEAYLSKLSDTNPEDKPEEFMELRKAYEEAVDYANQDEDDTLWAEEGYEKYIDDSEIGQWMADVIEVYKNFRRRNDLDEWNRLLDYDVCQNIGSKIDARSALLTFFMEYYNLPAKVIVLLNEFFDFEENLQELYDEFPPQFIDNILIYFLQNEEYPIYRFFEIEDGLDYDGFLDDFYNINREIGEKEPKEVYDKLQDLKEYGIYHPEIEKKEAYMLYYMKELDKALDILNNIALEYRDYKDDLLKGYIYSTKGDDINAEKFYLAVLEKNPLNYNASIEISKLYREKGKLFLARDYINDMICGGNRSDTELNELYDELNKQIVKEYEKSVFKLQDKYDDRELLEIANTYYMLDDAKGANDVLEDIEISDENDLMIYRLKGRICSIENKFEEALKYIDKWEEGIKNSSQEKLDSFHERYVNLGNVHYYRAIIYNRMGENIKALEQIDMASEISPVEVEYLSLKCHILSSVADYEKLLEACDKILAINPISADGFMVKIEALYSLNRFNELFETCDEFISMEPYHIFGYAYKIRTLIDVDELEAAKEILEDIISRGAEGTDTKFLQAYISEKEGNKEKAKKVYENLVNKLLASDENSNLSFNEEVYFRYANIVFDTVEDIDYESLLDIIENGLKHNPAHEGLLYYKALLLTNIEKYDEAIEVYEFIELLNPDNRYTDRFIGDNYLYKDMNEKALEYYNRQIKKDEDDIECYFKRVHVNIKLFNFEEVYDDLICLENKIDYDEPRLYEYYGYYYNILDEPKKAYDYFKRAKEIYDNSDGDSLYYLEDFLGTVCAKLDMRDESNKYFRENYILTGNAGALMDIYNNYVMSGDFANAEKILKEYFKAVRVTKLSSDYLSHMANLNIEKRNINGALKNFSLMLRPSPEQKKDRARALFYAGDSKKALALVEAAIDELGIDSSLDGYYLLASKICLDLGDKEKAHEYANKAIELKTKGDIKFKRNKLPNYYEVLGSAYTILGEYDKAMECLNKALTEPRCLFCTDPKCIEAMFSIAYLEYVRGNLDKAEDIIEEILELDVSRVDAILLAYKMGLLK